LRCRDQRRGGGRLGDRDASLRTEMQKTGRIEFYTPSKGYGFIRPDDGTAGLFFHVSAVVEGVVLMPTW
jgi:hypothetical protein